MVDRSSRARLSVAALLVFSLLLPVQSGRADSSPPTLFVNYTMDCTFTMTDDWGKTLTSVVPGSYQILVTSPVPFASVDLSGINDMTACKGSPQFALSGPGVSVTTTMDDGGSDTAVLDVTFEPSSTYTAVDDIQPTVAHFSFTTTAGTPPPPSVQTTAATTTTKAPTVAGGSSASSSPTPPAASSPDRGTLAATVTGTGSVALPYQGKAVTALRAGRYTVAVTDESRRTGFVVRQVHGATTWLSTGSFTGKRTRAIDFTKGQWSFSASTAGAKTYFIVLA